MMFAADDDEDKKDELDVSETAVLPDEVFDEEWTDEDEEGGLEPEEKDAKAEFGDDGDDF